MLNLSTWNMLSTNVQKTGKRSSGDLHSLAILNLRYHQVILASKNMAPSTLETEVPSARIMTTNPAPRTPQSATE